MTKIVELLVTSDHHCVLTPGGLMLLPTEELEGAQMRGQAITAKLLAGYQETLFLSLREILEIAAHVEASLASLEAQEQEIYLTRVAQAWLDEFAEKAQEYYASGGHWWPAIRREARHELLKLTQEGGNAVISAWSEAALRSPDFPLDQQEELLTRYFKRLYYERFPVPVRREEHEEKGE